MDTIAGFESVSDRWILEQAVIALLQDERGQQYLASLMLQADPSALGKLLNLIMWRCCDRDCKGMNLLDSGALPPVIRETVDRILGEEAGSERAIAALSFYTYETESNNVSDAARRVARGMVDRAFELQPDSVRSALAILNVTGDLQSDFQLRDVVLNAARGFECDQGRAALGFGIQISPESARDLARLAFESNNDGAFTEAACGLWRRYKRLSQPDGMEDEIVGFITQAMERDPQRFSPFCKQWLVFLGEVLPNRQSAYDLFSRWARATEPGEERVSIERMAEKVARGEAPLASPLEHPPLR
jgi:hypothetical protein